MDRKSSHGTNELFNLPPLVLKTSHLSESIGESEKALGWFPIS